MTIGWHQQIIIIPDIPSGMLMTRCMPDAEILPITSLSLRASAVKNPGMADSNSVSNEWQTIVTAVRLPFGIIHKGLRLLPLSN